jgi:hypothetical protein
VILYFGLFRALPPETHADANAIPVAPETITELTPHLPSTPTNNAPEPEPEPPADLALQHPEEPAPRPEPEPPRPEPEAPRTATQQPKKPTRPAASAPARPADKSPHGQLLIACAQPDLIVFIDGSGPYGCGRVTSFPPGDYAVRAHARGQEIRRVVHLKPGVQQRVSLNIE